MRTSRVGRVILNAPFAAVAHFLRRRVRDHAPYLLLLATAARAEISVPVSTEVGSGVTIKVASPVASVPRFGFMPVRVTVENNAPVDGTWRFRFDAGNARQFPGLGSSTFELAVPAMRNREVWFFVPMAEPGVSINPAAVTSGSAVPSPTLPAIPPPIAGIYPDPKTPGVSYQVNSAVSHGTAGLTRTFTITQIGPANALPPVPQVLPTGTTVSSTTRASDGLVTRTTVVPVTAPRPTTAGFTGTSASRWSFTPPTGSPPVSVSASRNAMNALTKAGLSVPGAQVSTSTRVDSAKPNAQVFTVTVRQSGPASTLPAVDLKTLPPGFTAVNVTPEGDGSTVVREFTYVEQVAMPAGGVSNATAFSGPTTAPARPKTPSDLQAEARRVLGPTRLLEAQAGVKTSVSTQFISLTSAGSPTPANLIGHSVVIFEQTGPASILSQVPNTLPSGVRVTRVPGTASGTAMRIVSYLDPDVVSGIIAHSNSLATNPSYAVPAATNLGRVELLRRGFLRNLPGVALTPLPTTRHSTPGTSGPPDLIIFSENGTAALLPQPPAEALPAGITCTVTPGAIPGEVARNFVISIPAFLAGQTVTAPASTAAGAPRRPVRVATGTILSPPMLFMEVSGPSVSRLTARLPFPSHIGNTAMPPLATTVALDSALRGKLPAAGIRVPPNIAALDPAQLPADWRVWSSFNTVLLKAEDHALLDPARRAALRSWVAMGGVLLLVPEMAGEADSERVGAGRIETLAEPIADIAPTDVIAKLQLTQLAPGMPEREQMMFSPGSRLSETVTFETPDMLWVSLLLVAFALLVGPGNVFFLAPAKKRHRLFFTTPILSLCGAAAIGGAILLQDGLGGDGRRRALVVLVPGESQAAVFQEQGARSGFLSKRDFALGENVICAALPVDGNIFLMSGGATTLARQGDEAGGDWFRNRSRQAHLLRTLAPTRARIELVGRAADGAPQVESTVATELRDFRLRDDAGRIWSADKVAAGRRTTLRPAAKPDPATEGNDGTPQLLALLREAAALTEPWQWVAHGGGIDIAPIPTLRAIRWEDEPITYAGVAERAGLASSAKEKRGE